MFTERERELLPVFAAAALQGLIAGNGPQAKDTAPAELAAEAFDIAEGMVWEHSKRLARAGPRTMAALLPPTLEEQRREHGV